MKCAQYVLGKLKLSKKTFNGNSHSRVAVSSEWTYCSCEW